MTYRSFRLNCVVRILIIGATVYLLVYLISKTSLYATMAIVGSAVLIQIALLVRYVEKTNRDLTRFLSSIRYSDFSQSFEGGLRGKSFEELGAAFSEVISEFQKARAEKEEQYRYLQTVVQHIGLGIISYDADGNVDLINNAAKRLLDVASLKSINSLRSFSEPLVDMLYHLGPGEKDLVRVDSPGRTLQIIIYATEFKLRDRSLKLVSMQNIERELSEKEMEAWQKLIRVLTHEIMNSVTPIASLASTINDLVTSSSGSQDSGTADLTDTQREDIVSAANTIERRSRGLLNFVDAYKRLTRIPNPNFQIFPVSELLGRVSQLMADQMKREKIDLMLMIEPESLELTADAELIEQVVINLLLNSIQAMRGTEDRRIRLESRLDERGRITISVTDNGTGIGDDIKDKIFTPFFTTRKDGSGIGLSLSRQIMRLHGGSISVESAPGEKTVVLLTF